LVENSGRRWRSIEPDAVKIADLAAKYHLDAHAQVVRGRIDVERHDYYRRYFSAPPDTDTAA
jgi:hypothetical protein